MTENLQNIKKSYIQKITNSSRVDELDSLENALFGRQKGELTILLKSLKNLDPAKRKIIGQQANNIKSELEALMASKRKSLKSSETTSHDLSASTGLSDIGRLHPVTLVKREIESIFRSMGFASVTGPEIETDFYNFGGLNMAEEHPARDMWDTFYVKSGTNDDKSKKRLLRTHISPVQIRIMEKTKPPFAVFSSGRVFRREATDARHEHTYDYTEGFAVAKNLNFAQLKWVLKVLFENLFGKDVNIKFRPSYFPFTEPSLELLMGCIFCKQKGCSVCHTGWLEMLGAGMIHPAVFENAGYPKGKYQGFAFGIGISRVVMLKYNIPDIRMLYQNDTRLLEQF
jgi:phenylalanyl-tRNA synthetase alpha chain